MSLAFAVKTGEGGKMFGAITAADIYEKLVAAGYTIDKKRIHLHTPVKTLGQHTVKVKLHADVSVDINFDVVSENPRRCLGKSDRGRSGSGRREARREGRQEIIGSLFLHRRPRREMRPSCF